MAERTRIGLIFSYDENWIGGAYYILNIVHALNTVNDIRKPHIVVLATKNEDFELLKNSTKYPYLSYFKFPAKAHYSIIERVINKLSRLILNKNTIIKKPSQPDISFLYPAEHKSIQIDGLKKVNWIPDFQEEFLPQFFSEEEILKRKKLQKETVAQGDSVVFSSKDAQQHFQKLYPESKADLKVIHFAVTHPDFSNEDIHLLKKKYDLPNNYFFAPNQFWAHKNHMVILKAVKQLKDKGEEIVVAFSGKEQDRRNIGYVDKLKAFINQNQLEPNIKFLGFIERTEQLCILKNAMAVIQPSLFEGWSTVVEDAKSIEKHLILSNLNVHKEQIDNGVTFFNPNSEIELASIIQNMVEKLPENYNHNYDKKILSFGNDFLKLVENNKINPC
jgi:glycosyltransferase involved in cell wall biosynthesis